MDEKKIKFVSWIGHILITIGGLSLLSTFNRFPEYTLEGKYALLGIVLFFFGVGILFEFWSHLLSRIRASNSS